MIDPKHKHSHFFIAIFTIFWIGFAVFYAIEQHGKKSSDMPSIMKRGVLRVCGEEDLFSFYEDGKIYQGFHYELAKAFADRHGLKLEYTGRSDFRDRLKMLESGRCDILAGPLPVVADYREVFAYTEPLYESNLVLVQRNKENNDGKRPIRDQILLADKRIAVTEHSPDIIRIHNLAQEISDSIHIRQYLGFDNESLIEGVSSGILDYMACDKYVARAYAKKYPRIDVKTTLGLTQYQAWAVGLGRKGTLDSLNAFIAEYKKSPAYARLLKKYME